MGFAAETENIVINLTPNGNKQTQQTQQEFEKSIEKKMKKKVSFQNIRHSIDDVC